MGETKTTNPFLVLELDAAEREFANLGELQKWVSDEREAFKWLLGLQGDICIRSFIDDTNRWLSQVDNFISHYSSHDNDGLRQRQLIETIKFQTQEAFKNGRLRTSESPDTEFVFGLRDQYSDYVAGCALLCLTHRSISDAATADALEGALLALLYRHRGELDRLTKRLEKTEQIYTKKLALQASVGYWDDKRKHHRNMARWMGFLTLVVAGGTGYLFVDTAYDLLEETLPNISVGKLGIMLAISTFGIWLTRLFSKIFVSNLHLRTDAGERVTMILTYLALLREEKGLEHEDRKLILQALFRPSVTGFIKEDGPVSPIEVISRAMDK